MIKEMFVMSPDCWFGDARYSCDESVIDSQVVLIAENVACVITLFAEGFSGQELLA
jgi:hypothetical protein